VVYLDGDSDRKLSPLDEIYILEPDSQGNPQLTWGLIVQTSSKTDPPPVPGDSFLFKTLKPVRSGDTFEFRGNLVSVRDKLIASSFRLDQNYPNPFNPSTTISFTVGTTGVATLEIFNILGNKSGRCLACGCRRTKVSSDFRWQTIWRLACISSTTGRELCASAQFVLLK